MTETRVETRVCALKECGKPLIKRDNEKEGDFSRRETCGAACGAKFGFWRRQQNNPKLSQTRLRKARPQSGWPKITGEIDWNNAFAAHNIIPPNEYGSLPHRADVRTYTGCSAAMAYVRGE